MPGTLSSSSSPTPPAPCRTRCGQSVSVTGRWLSWTCWSASTTTWPANHPDRHPHPRLRRRANDMTVEHVYFRSGDVRCAADLYLPEDTPAAGVVMGHSVLVVKKALAPHAEYLFRAGF